MYAEIPYTTGRTDICKGCHRRMTQADRMYRVGRRALCERCANRIADREAKAAKTDEECGTDICPDCGTRHPGGPCGVRPTVGPGSDKRRRNGRSGYSGGDGMTPIY